jgi:LysR family glycine cleavage system transcriptional activator
VPDLPPLAALRAFDAAARHLSFRRAAEELSVTQSAVSHQIAELERRLGSALFSRQNRRVELTDAGRLYAPYVRESLVRLAEGTRLVMRAGRSLDVQVYVTVAVRWLIPRLHSFVAAEPDLLVRFNTSHLDWEFDEASADVAIVCTAHPDRPRLRYTHLFHAQLVPVCSPTLPRGRRRLHHPADLADHALLHVFPAAEEWTAWLAAAGVPDVKGGNAPAFDSYLLAIEAATDGQGVAIVPRFLVAGDLASGRLVAPFPLQVPQPRRWYLVCRDELANDSRVQSFLAWLTGEIAADPTLSCDASGVTGAKGH